MTETEETQEPAPRRDRRVALLLWMLPLWLVVSAVVGLWLHFHREEKAAEEQQPRFATAVSASGLESDVGKFLNFAGERHPGHPEGLSSAAAMIEGSLGTSNAGYKVESLRGPSVEGSSWPILIVSLRGSHEKLPPLWVVAGYDARRGSKGAEANASGSASVLAAASALAGATPKRAVNFAFLPHAYDPDSPLAETFSAFRERVDKASEVLVVEGTGAGEKLLLSSRDATSRALRLAGDLGEVVGAESICLEDDFDLSAALFETALPAVRVSTRPVVKAGEADETAPDPAKHAAATKALVSLIEKLSDS